MSLSGKRTKRAISLALCLAVLVSMVAFVLSARAEEVGAAVSGADTDPYDGSEGNLTQSKELADTGASYGYVYCKNTAGWSSVNAYMWVKGTQTSNAQWPGKAMTKVSGNIWRYEVTDSSWSMIIFNDGSNQTADLDYPGAGYIYDNSTKQWSVYETQPTTTNPTTVNPTTVSPTTQSGSTAGKTYVYCENEAGWSTVTAYMWIKDTQTSNAGWPGAAMTKIGGNIWRYEVTNSKFNMIIFSNNGQSQTADLTFPGKDYIWNNSTNTWSIYDTSPLQVTSFATDYESPQYNGVAINLSAAAEGQGTVYYKFSVTSGSSTTVLSDYSTRNQVEWIPQSVGTYTLTYEFRDTAGNTNKRTKTYTIEDGSASEAPYIMTVTPNGGEIQNNVQKSFVVKAGGGNTGTKLLFYKYTVKDASGNILNVPYYTRNSIYSYKPTKLGEFTVTVSVQGSDNKTVENTYSFTSVGSVTPTSPAETMNSVPDPTTPPPTQPQPTTPPATQPQPTTPKPTTPPPTQPQPTAPQPQPTESGSRIIYGDADDDGDVTIIDATVVQRYEAGVPMSIRINELAADVDADEMVTIIDATLIQRFNAGVIVMFPAER